MPVESYERQGELWLFREFFDSSRCIAIAGVECTLQELFLNLETEAAASA
jgi:hypothetical protein